jgi:hypothetical protein
MTKHLYWAFDGPPRLASLLETVTIGLGRCNSAQPRSQLTLDAAEVDCPICLERHQLAMVKREEELTKIETEVVTKVVISRDTKINVVDAKNINRGAAKVRFDQLVAASNDIKTVADYLDKIKGARMSDIPWWLERGKIQVGT